MANSHKREPNARARTQDLGRTLGRVIARSTAARTTRVAGAAAVLATLPVIGVGVLHAAPAARHIDVADVSSSGAFARALTAEQIAGRSTFVSRSSDRTLGRASAAPTAEATRAAEAAKVAKAAKALTAKAVADATVHRWTTTDLNLWATAADGAQQFGLISSGKQVLTTGRAADSRVEIVVHGDSRWVTTGYLSTDEPSTTPVVGAAAGLSMAPCPDGSVDYRLTSAAIYVYRSVCHAFPQITTYGGWAARGEHASGKAIDIMTSDAPLGDAIADFLRAHASELNLFDVIWQQRIWTPVRAAEGWRLMSNRGSATANHYDHVHVSVN